MAQATGWDGLGNAATVREVLNFLDELHARRFHNGTAKGSSFELLDLRTSLHIRASAAETADPVLDEERALIALLQAFQRFTRSCRGNHTPGTVKRASAAAGRADGSAPVPARGTMVRGDIAGAGDAVAHRGRQERAQHRPGGDLDVASVRAIKPEARSFQTANPESV